MPNFAASISMMFTEHALPDRFMAARQAGFGAVEIQMPYETEPEVLARAREAAGIEVALIYTPMGDADKGEAGLAALPGREAQFREGIAVARRYAEALNCRRVHVLAGIPGAESDAGVCLGLFAENLAQAGAVLELVGAGVLVEPVNGSDRPGYFVGSVERALDAITRAGRANVGMLCDVYHLQIMGEEPIATIARLKDTIGHIQFADAPGRHQPGTGGLDFAAIFEGIDGLGYAGWVGAEYQPSGTTAASLAWLAEFG